MIRHRLSFFRLKNNQKAQEWNDLCYKGEGAADIEITIYQYIIHCTRNEITVV